MKKHKVLELFDNQLFTETEHLYRGSGSKYTWTNKITEDKFESSINGGIGQPQDKINYVIDHKGREIKKLEDLKKSVDESMNNIINFL